MVCSGTVTRPASGVTIFFGLLDCHTPNIRKDTLDIRTETKTYKEKSRSG